MLIVVQWKTNYRKMVYSTWMYILNPSFQGMFSHNKLCSDTVWVSCELSHSTVSDFMWLHGLYPAKLSVHEISQTRIWSWLLFPPPGSLLDPGIKPTSTTSAALAGSLFTTEPPGKALGCPTVQLNSDIASQRQHQIPQVKDCPLDCNLSWPMDYKSEVPTTPSLDRLIC